MTQRTPREAELLDLATISDLAVQLAQVAGAGVIGNAAYDAIKAALAAYRTRKGGRAAAEVLGRARAESAALPGADSSAILAAMADDLELPLPEPEPTPEPTPRRWRWAVIYARPDRAFATALHDALGPDAFLDYRSIPPGALWMRAVPTALRSADTVVVLLSSRSEGAWYLEDEIVRAVNAARSGGPRVVPVYLDGFPTDIEGVPYGLAVLQGVDWTAEGGAGGVARRLGGS